MVESQQYCLKWNNYQTSLSSSFKDLLANETFVDCTLTCGQHQGGQAINAHRVVLSACSPYLRQVLSNLSHGQHPVIILKDIKYQELSGIIEFIYHGEVSIDQECLPGFLQAAESLRIKGLTEEKKKPVEQTVSSVPSKSFSPNKSTLIHKALKQLINGSGKQVSTDSEDNNNDDIATVEDNITAEHEEEEEALSESEIPDDSIRGMDFQTMYRSFMSGSVSEDSDVSKEMIGAALEETNTATMNFSDSNSPVSGGKKTCPYCYQQLSWHALSRHIRDMHKAKTDLVNCKYCMKTFRNKNSLGCHIWRFHKRGKELIGVTGTGAGINGGGAIIKSDQEYE